MKLRDIIEKLRQYPVSDLYRFIVDGRFHENQNGWYGYELREPGCLPSVFDAFQYALETDIQDLHISTNLIKAIHEKAMGKVNFKSNDHEYFNSFKSENSGKYRSKNEKSKFLINSGNCDEDGLEELKEFIQFSGDKWCKISCQNTGYQGEATYDAISNLSYYYYPPQSKNISLLMERICKEYNEAIKLTKTDDEKLEIIINCVQKLDRIHPFLDGNVRITYILLQRFLIQNGFLPTMMLNPNHFDGFSKKSVIAEVKMGMSYTEKLIKDHSSEIFNYKTKNCRPRFIKDTIKHIIDSYYVAENKLGDFIKNFYIPIEGDEIEIKGSVIVDFMSNETINENKQIIDIKFEKQGTINNRFFLKTDNRYTEQRWDENFLKTHVVDVKSTLGQNVTN